MKKTKISKMVLLSEPPCFEKKGLSLSIFIKKTKIKDSFVKLVGFKPPSHGWT